MKLTNKNIIEEIKSIYSQILDKNLLVEKIAKKFFLQVSTIKNRWFTGKWAIPTKYQSSVLDIMKEEMQSQIENHSKLLSNISKN